MLALGVSLSNVVCGMEQDEKKRKRNDKNSEQSKKIKTEYDAKATQELQTLLNNSFLYVSVEKIKGLLNDNANPNIQDKYSYRPLHTAALGKHKEIVEILLEYGANPNIKDKDNNPPLHIAAVKGYEEIVEMLLKYGANPNIKNKAGRTPLLMAAWGGHKEIVKILLKCGANPNIKDKDNNPPLHIAAVKGYEEVVEILLKHGVKPNLKNNDNDTTLHLAAEWGQKKVVESIINFIKDGAQISDDNLKQLEYLCSIDKIFRKQCEIFLIINKKKGFFKIPKYLCHKILVQSWNPNQCITELLNDKNKNGKTIFDLAHEEAAKTADKSYEDIVTLIQPYEKLESGEKKESNPSKSWCILN
jgi:ankyrin repeat protein